jgi:hypothetical protein
VADRSGAVDEEAGLARARRVLMSSRVELKDLVHWLRIAIDEKLAGNYQLVTALWLAREVGDGHLGRGLASGWTLLHLVRWLRRDGMDT